MSVKSSEEVFFGDIQEEKSPEEVFFGDVKETPIAVQEKPERFQRTLLGDIQKLITRPRPEGIPLGKYGPTSGQPGIMTRFEDYAKEFREQQKGMSFKDRLKGGEYVARKIASGLSLGAIEAPKPPKGLERYEAPANFLQTAADFVPMSSLISLGRRFGLQLGKRFLPAFWMKNPLMRILGGAGGGLTYETAKKTLGEERLPSVKEMAQDYGKWLALETGLGVGELALQTRQVINGLSANTGLSKRLVSKYLMERMKFNFRNYFGKAPTTENFQALAPKEIQNLWVDTISKISPEEIRNVEAFFPSQRPSTSAKEMIVPSIKSAKSKELGATGTQPLLESYSIKRAPPSGVSKAAITASESLTRTGPTLIFDELTIGKPSPTSNKVILQGSGDINKVLNAFTYLKPEIDKSLNSFIKTLPFNIELNSRLKKEENLIRKLKTKNRQPYEVPDYYAARLIFGNIEEAKEGFQKFIKKYDFFDIEDQLHEPKNPYGYRGLHGQVSLGNGLSIELQFATKDLINSFDEARKIYIKWRHVKKDTLTFTQLNEYKKDLERSKKIFTDAYEKSLKIKPKQLPAKEKVSFPIKQEGLPPVKPPPKEPLPPPSEEEPAAPEKITPETAKFFSKLAAKVNIEYPFQKVGAPKTGFAVKNYYDQINKHIEQGAYAVKQINKLGLTKEQLNNAVLQAESAIPPKDHKERQAWTMIRSWFDKALEDLQSQDVLKKGFVENIASNILAEIKALDDGAKVSKNSRVKAKLYERQKELLEDLKEITKLKFVSIPVRSLFDDVMKGDPARVRRAVRYLNKKRRKTIRLQDLVDSGLVDKKDLTPDLIINSYARKYGRDIALAKIINAAKSEGLATLEPKEGYVKIPGYVAPELAKYYIHPAFADYIQAYTSPSTFGAFEKITQVLKGWSFYNPLIVPINDIVQQAMYALGDPRNLWRLPKNYVKAFKSFWKKDALYWELFDKGLFSQPFVMPEKDFKNLFEWFKKGEEPIWLKALKLPVKLHDKIYDAMSALAWGGDRLIRISTALQMIEDGASLKEAAQLSALFHGDYSRVPAKTRRKLNKFLWTPTFKIVMGALHNNILKNGWKIANLVLKGEKIPPKEKILLKGLLGGLVFFGAIDILMNSLGFKRDVFGLRYSKEIEDENGKTKTLHLNFSNPANLPLKFLYRAYESATKPGEANPFLSFLRKNKYELAIPIQIAWEIFNNKTRKYDNIYEPYDSFEKKLLKVTNYLTKRVIPLYGMTDEDESFVSEDSKEILYKELGQFGSIIPGIFPYVTEPDKIRKAKKVQSLTHKFLQKAKRKALEGKPISEEEKESFRKEVSKILED